MKFSIEDFLREVDIKTVVEMEAGVELEPVGTKGEYRGLCPFHSERTPSFFVNPEQGLYHCFGCGAGGNTINFVMDLYGLDFKEAVKYLVEKYAPQYDSDRLWKKAESEYASMRKLARYLYKKYILSGKYPQEILNYLTEERGVSYETIKEIGILPFVKEDFLRLDRKLQAGLNINIDKISDTAIIFPIKDTPGRLVGFVVRNLGKEPKYINSKGLKRNETPFLGYYAYREIRQGKRDYLIVVEGIIDAILVRQAGFKNVIASQGTDIPLQYISRLKKYITRVFLMLDKDASGKEATKRALGQILSMELIPYLYPSGSYFGKKDFGDLKDYSLIKKIIEGAVPYRNALLETIRTLKAREGTEGLIKARRIIKEIASHIKNDVMREAFEKEFIISNETTKSKNTSQAPKAPVSMIESVRKTIYIILAEKAPEVAERFRPSDENVYPLPEDISSYLTSEIEEYLRNPSGSLLRYFEDYNVLRLKKDSELFSDIFSRIYRKQPLRDFTKITKLQ